MERAESRPERSESRLDRSESRLDRSASAASARSGRDDLLTRSLRRVARRLFAARLLRALSVDAVVFASLYALALAAERSFALGLEPLPLLGATALAWVFASVARSFVFSRVDEQLAATETDARLALRERVASALWLRRSPGERDDAEWAELVVRDGVRALERADLRAHFPITVPRLLWSVCVPALAATALWFWMPALDLLGVDAERRVAEAMRRDVDDVREDYLAALEAIEAEARESQHAELERFLAELREQAALAGRRVDPSGEESGGDGARPEADLAKREALAQISKQLESVEKRLAVSEHLRDARKALEELRRESLQDTNLTRRLLSSLKRSDIGGAQKELDRLGDELRDLKSRSETAGGALSAEQKSRLDQLAEELARLASRMPSSRAGLASGLSSASRGLQGLDLDKALEGLELSRQDLERLAKDSAELEMLAKTEEELQKAQQQLSKVDKHQCPNCGKPRLEKPGQKPGGT